MCMRMIIHGCCELTFQAYKFESCATVGPLYFYKGYFKALISLVERYSVAQCLGCEDQVDSGFI